MERTVTYVSAALDHIKRKSSELQTDAWLCVHDRRAKQLFWNHTKFVIYKYDQQVAEQKIGKILMNAKIEQLKIDAHSIPWKYTFPDGAKSSGQLR